MKLLQLLTFPLLALAAVVPSNMTLTKRGGPYDYEPVDAPPYWCGHIMKGVYSRYILRGREWFWHEDMYMETIIKAQPACYMTNWRYREETRDNGKVDFDLIFHMPFLCQKRLQRSINEYLGFKDAKKGGVYCPEVKDSRYLEDLRNEIGPRRPHDKWTDDEEHGGTQSDEDKKGKGGH